MTHTEDVNRVKNNLPLQLSAELEYLRASVTALRKQNSKLENENEELKAKLEIVINNIEYGK